MIYPNDHRPTHVHVIGDRHEAAFELQCPNGPPELRENYGFSQRDVGRVRKTLSASLAATTGGSSMASHDEFDDANTRGTARRDAAPWAVSARYDRRLARVVVRLSTGLEVAFAPDLAQGLEKARPGDLTAIEISPSGLGLYFPKLDADLYLPALLEGLLGSRQWMAARLGQRGGKVRSASKAAASRANGKLGGRPRKAAKVN